MKLTSSLCLVLMVILVLINYRAFYWLGYWENEGAFMAANPIVNLFLEALLFLVLVALLFLSLFRRKQRAWMFCAVLVFWPLFIGIFIALPARAPQRAFGIRDRMMRDYGLPALRVFAGNVDEVLPDTLIIHGDTSGLAAREASAFDGLRAKYSFLNWMRYGAGKQGGPSIQDRDGQVTVAWGGALSGHWGFSIAVKGGETEPTSGPNSTILRASSDIFFFDEE